MCDLFLPPGIKGIISHIKNKCMWRTELHQRISFSFYELEQVHANSVISALLLQLHCVKYAGIQVFSELHFPI